LAKPSYTLVQDRCSNECIHSTLPGRERYNSLQHWRRGRAEPGFSEHLIRSALIRALSSEHVYLSNRQSMSIRVYFHTASKRAETPTLLDSGATENFINHQYAAYLHLPVKRLATPWRVYNVDGTANKKGDIQFYVDLEVRTGEKQTNMRFFLTDLGPQCMILGYPWFAAIQPRIDWAKGWIDYSQLPVVVKTPHAQQARITKCTTTIQRKQSRRITRLRSIKQTKASQLAEQHCLKEKPTLPPPYQRHEQVFSEKRA
jgi:hypothetical protein